jgi:GTP diphosphokinase / guanosine-3',5'-bis(diphosphate) 3'-diphosphatase
MRAPLPRFEDGCQGRRRAVAPHETQMPDFVEGSALLGGAYLMALEAHEGPRRQDETGIDHPVGVARILQEHEFDEKVVAAALLHDVIEDTDTSPEEIRERFGGEVAGLVREMTEDESIEPYVARKSEHRRRVARDQRVAAIYAADKIANARDFQGSAEEIPDHKLEHYVQTFRVLCDTHPELPFLEELRRELEELSAERGRKTDSGEGISG